MLMVWNQSAILPFRCETRRERLVLCHRNRGTHLGFLVPGQRESIGSVVWRHRGPDELLVRKPRQTIGSGNGNGTHRLIFVVPRRRKLDLVVGMDRKDINLVGGLWEQRKSIGLVVCNGNRIDFCV